MARIVFILISPVLLLIVHSVQENLAQDCPPNCICYKEYLSNLASWKWIETDINIQKDDPLHEDFNPYTEYNEVYDNPVAVKKRRREQILETVTCILRTNSSDMLANSLRILNPNVQILSLIQAPGTGSITLEKDHLEKLTSLIGLEVQGYSPSGQIAITDSLFITADAFSILKKLTYLSVEAVILLQRPAATPSQDVIIKYQLDENSPLDENGQPTQVIIVKARSSTNKDAIVPYSVYKTGSKSQSQSQPVEPQIAVAFTELPSLQHLRISSCNLQDISWDMFYKLDNLKFLLLDNNDLLFLPDFVFYATSNLTALSLSNNRILNLQTVGLAGLLYLQKLDISYNNITYLSELSLPPFPHLEVADFRHNPIESIFPNTFEIMNSTKTLFLGSHSTPLEFSPNSFYGLVSLSRLDIINVRIEFLERAMLKGMPELKSLTMTGTISRILYDAFSEVPKLERLVLKQCSIKKISMDAFFGLTSVIELDLSHNDLTFLPPGIFDQQTSLREIFLQYNKIKTLPPSIFSKIPSKLIRLEGNPWHCSCDMKYWDSRQINQVKRYHVPEPNSTQCQRQYDKGSMCFKNYEPTFEARYVYEKRVSPTCLTPEKFKKRSVFEVMRKDLQFCANSLKQNISILLTSSNPTETLEIMGAVRIPVDPTKEIEKKLLFPPKIKKPWAIRNIIPQNRSLINATTDNKQNIGNNLQIDTDGIASLIHDLNPSFSKSDFTGNRRPNTESKTKTKKTVDDNRINIFDSNWNPNSAAESQGVEENLLANSVQYFPLSEKAQRFMRNQQNVNRRKQG